MTDALQVFAKKLIIMYLCDRVKKHTTAQEKEGGLILYK